jgi:hypothetical protein
MNNIYVPSRGIKDWKKLLANSNKQWKTGFSAKELAIRWETANGFPDEFQCVLQKTAFLLAIPEYKVFLDTNKAPSQSDLFVFAKDDSGLITIVVEGKKEDSFAKLITNWNTTKGTSKRLEFLLGKLEISSPPPPNIGDYRYQLFHRTVSAILLAEKFGAKKAMMIVHSFSQKNTGFDDYAKFATLLNPEINPQIDEIIECKTLKSGIKLYTGWIKG